jgi:ERCC4-type nuclease
MDVWKKINEALEFTDVPEFDTREYRSGIFTYLDSEKIPYKKAVREIGDVGFQNIFAIEIKRIYEGAENDLRESLYSKLLYKELQKQRDNFSHSFLIIEGDLNFCRESINGFDTMIETVQIDYNAHIFLTSDYKATIEQIYKIWYRLRNGTPFRIFLDQKRGISIRQKRLNVLSMLFDVGLKKASRLLHQFGSINGVFDWIKNLGKSWKLKGFGKKFFEKNNKLIFECGNDEI